MEAKVKTRERDGLYDDLGKKCGQLNNNSNSNNKIWKYS